MAEEPLRSLYSGALVVRYSNAETKVSPAVCLARSEQEAIGIMLQEAHKHWPKEEGYFDYMVGVERIGAAFVQNCAQRYE